MAFDAQTFRPRVGGTFSDTWYRVADTRPRLSPHVEIVPQQGRLGVRYVVEEAAGGSYFHLSESAYRFAALLDGRRTVEDAWNACNAQLGDEAPTQREVVDLLGQLQMQGFLLGDQPVAADLLAKRRQTFRTSKLRKRTGNYLFFHVPLINPEPILERTRHLFAPFFTRWGLVAWLLLVSSAGLVVLSNLDRAASGFNSVLSASNLLWLSLALIVVRAVHEAGHAVACKAVGARCVEIGVMLVGVVLPLPYCDATSAWKRPRTRDRAVVSLGGILFEGVLASAATFYWAYAEPGIGRTIAFNVMLISGVSSVVFNLNPLLRYDGYYLLTDLARSPNLAQRARAVWIFFIERFGFGVRAVQPPYVRGRDELWLLVAYHALAVPYRLLVLLAILLMISQQYFTIGLVLAAVFVVVWAVVPVTKFCWYLATSPKLRVHRLRAAGVTAGVLVPVVGFAALVPLPGAVFATGTVSPAERVALRLPVDGFVDRVHIRSGSEVRAGDVLLELRNPNLELDLASARAKLAYDEAVYDGALHNDPLGVERARLAVELSESLVSRLEAERDSLLVRAPADGVVSTPEALDMELGALVGRFGSRGDRVAWLHSGPRVVRTRVSDREYGRLVNAGSVSDREREDGVDGGHDAGGLAAAGARVTLRLRGDAGRVIEGRVVRQPPSGSIRLDDPALGAAAGGELLTRPDDPAVLLEPYFRVDVAAVDDAGFAANALTGRRARVRFSVPAEPLLPRAWRSVRRYLDGRVVG
ncbi:MAG: PqqD family peptide modification chaperone [Planctomycetota bacterium]